jgi:hypothetical protein
MERKMVWGDIADLTSLQEQGENLPAAEKQVYQWFIKTMASAESIEQVNLLEQQAKAVLEKLGALEATITDPQEKKMLKESIRFFADRITQIFAAASFIVGAAVIGYVPMNYGLEYAAKQWKASKDFESWRSTRYQVQKRKNEKGETLYEHEDTETTEILNYLAGRGEIGEETQLTCIREVIGTNYDKEGKFTDQIYGLTSVQEAKEFLSTHFDDFKAQAGAVGSYYDLKEYKTGVQFAEVETRAIIRWHKAYRRTLSPKLYEALWDIERTAGNPKIRWARGPEARRVNRDKTSVNDTFSADTNTIRLDSALCTYHLFDSYAAEAAHAQNYQLDYKSFLSRVEGEGNLIESYFNIFNTRQSVTYGQARDRLLYNIPGTEEYKAHREVEPAVYKKIAPVVKVHKGASRNQYEDER